MAKRKKPVSIFSLPKEEVAKAGSEIIRKTSREEPPIDPPPTKPTPKPKAKPTPRKPVVKKSAAPPKTPPPVPVGTGKRKFLYVDEATHLQAKISAAKRGMKLQQYIAWLITNDQSV